MIDALLKKRLFFLSLFSVAAFLLLASKFSTLVYWTVPFRKMYIPVLYWALVSAGIYVISIKLCKEKVADAFREAIPVFFIFHLIVLCAQMWLNPVIYVKLGKPYFVYIVAAQMLIVLGALLWALYPVFRNGVNRKREVVVRSPLFIAVPLCFFYSLINFSKMGILAFGSAIILMFIALFFLMRKTKRAGALYSYITRAYDFFRAHYRMTLILIFLLAFFVRLFFSINLIIKTGGDYLIAGDDSMSYHAAALEVVKDPHHIVSILAKMPWPPLYMVFLSMIYAVFGPNYYIVTIFQSVAGALMAVMVCLLAERLFNRASGVIAGILTALSQPIIFNASVIGTEAIYIPMIVFSIWMLLEGFCGSDKFRYLKLILSGAVFGIAAMTLGSISLYPIGLFVCMLLFRNKKMRFKRQVVFSCIFFLAFMAAYFSVRYTFYHFTPIGKAYYESEGVYPWREPTTRNYDTIDPDNREFIALGIDPFERPRESLQIAVKHWRQVLAIAARIYPIKVRGYYFFANFGFFDPIFFVNGARLANNYSLTLEFYSVLAFLIGLIAALRLKNRWPLYVIVLYILYYTLIHGFVFMVHNVRYHCPLKPFLIVFTGYGIYTCLEYFKRENAGRMS